jgi:hypothetical protein
MARKKYLLLRSKIGNFIVVDYAWYVDKRIAKARPKMWWIDARSDDKEMLVAMANLTDRYITGGGRTNET